MKIPRQTQTVYREHALLVGTVLPKESSINHPLNELELLAKTAGAIIAGKITQKKDRPNPTYYIGRGKVDEIKLLIEENNIDTVIFNNNLSPAQIRNLEKELRLKVIDRTELILDIFATHARTRQAKLQVELAQLEYTLPRLKRMWSHLSRIEGGIGIGQRGPGEKQIEIDRRLARNRITKLKRQINDINKRRQTEAKNRSAYFTIALIGYTNAGKSTLMNSLTGTNCLTENKLFSTLDTKTQLWDIKNSHKVLLSDTVGFIKNLPHHLIASFNATLQEVVYADLLLHIVDSSNPDFQKHIKEANKVLSQLGCGEKPTLLIFNKSDKTNSLDMQIYRKQHPESILISAYSKEGFDNLTKKITILIDKNKTRSTFTIPASDGKLLAYLSRTGNIINKFYKKDKIIVSVALSRRSHNIVTQYLNTKDKSKATLNFKKETR